MKESTAAAFRFAADSAGAEIAAAEIVGELCAGKSIYITGATIVGPLTLDYLTIKGELNLGRCIVTDALSARNAILERRINVIDTSFAASASFEGAVFWRGVALNGSSFQQGACFRLAQLHQGIFCPGTRFSSQKRDASEPALDCSRAKVGEFMSLANAQIEGDLKCGSLEIAGACNAPALKCRGAGKADFCELIVQGDFCLENAVFEGSVDFSYARISGEANFQGVQFLGGKAADDSNACPNSFFSASFRSGAYFERALFKSVALFTNLTVHGKTSFGQDDPGTDPAHGNAARFGGDLVLINAEFNGEFRFVGGEVDGQAFFQEARFAGNAVIATRFNFGAMPVTFARARFKGTTAFDCRFAGGLSLFQAQFSGPLQFARSCAVEGQANLRGVSAYSIQFTRAAGIGPPMPFGGDVDMRQCRYRALGHDEGVAGIEKIWRTLRDRWRQRLKEESAKAGFEVQPYEQFEKVCRKQGLDDLADEIYYELRTVQHGFETRKVFLAWDWMECWLFGWGVKPLRMVGRFVMFWAVGTLIFCLPRTQAALETNGILPAHSRFYAAPLISLCNLVPGLGELRTLQAGPNWLSPIAAICVILQHLLGWMLLALIARRFFGGLSRAGGDAAGE